MTAVANRRWDAAVGGRQKRRIFLLMLERRICIFPSGYNQLPPHKN
jgi:hypothetical protein